MYFSPRRSKMRIGLVGMVCALFSPWVLGAQPPSKSEDAREEEMTGLVVKVIDGDSIKIREEGSDQTHEVQIEGTDAPEAKQPYGGESTEALRKMIFDRKVRITWSKKDNFDRRLAQVYLGDEHINQTMIRDGHAWHFKRYTQSKQLAQLEEEARKAKKGLWGAENPQAPWDYRKENRTPDKPDR
ncbi:MAG: thermonuclease family protein [Planctomycetota bacterium]